MARIPPTLISVETTSEGAARVLWSSLHCGREEDFSGREFGVCCHAVSELGCQKAALAWELYLQASLELISLLETEEKKCLLHSNTGICLRVSKMLVRTLWYICGHCLSG